MLPLLYPRTGTDVVFCAESRIFEGNGPDDWLCLNTRTAIHPGKTVVDDGRTRTDLTIQRRYPAISSDFWPQDVL